MSEIIQTLEKKLSHPLKTTKRGTPFVAMTAQDAKLILNELRSVAIMARDYCTLAEHAKISESIFECETCGAWLERDDPAAATTEDYHGCWKVAAGEADTGNNCRSYRALIKATPNTLGTLGENLEQSKAK